MNDEVKEADFSTWFSTYGVLTAERVLGGFGINLHQEELVTAVKNPHSIYHQLLQIPLKNTLNGIIRQQAHDYQVYAQKLFIDFLLSGQNDKEEGAPGGNTREDLESERKNLVDLGKAFNQQEDTHLKLIAETQAKLIRLASDLQNSLKTATKKTSKNLSSEGIKKSDDSIRRAIRTALICYGESEDTQLSESSIFWKKMSDVLDIEFSPEQRDKLSDVVNEFNQHRDQINQVLADYQIQVDDVSGALGGYRRQLYDLILRTKALIQNLSDYHMDDTRDSDNLEAISFDSSIGER